MRNLIVLLAAAFLLACGGSSTKIASTPETPAPETKRPPWESFTGPQAEPFKGCELGTKLMKDSLTWQRAQLDGTTNPRPIKGKKNRYVDFRLGPIGEFAMLQFKLDTNGKLVYELGVFQLPTGPNPDDRAIDLVIDFYAYRDLLLGVTPQGETSPDVLFASATGEYFCVVPQ